jgi:hypothetical protein
MDPLELPDVPDVPDVPLDPAPVPVPDAARGVRFMRSSALMVPTFLVPVVA